MRIIDAAKKAALEQQLLESVTTTAPGEKLDEKLKVLVFDEGLLSGDEEDLDRESTSSTMFEIASLSPSSPSTIYR